MNEKAIKTRYSDEELSEFETLIDNKLQESKEQLNFYMSQLAERADNADTKVKGLDDGIGTAENERMTTMAVRTWKMLRFASRIKYTAFAENLEN